MNDSFSLVQDIHQSWRLVVPFIQFHRQKSPKYQRPENGCWRSADGWRENTPNKRWRSIITTTSTSDNSYLWKWVGLGEVKCRFLNAVSRLPVCLLLLLGKKWKSHTKTTDTQLLNEFMSDVGGHQLRRNFISPFYCIFFFLKSKKYWKWFSLESKKVRTGHLFFSFDTTPL